MSDKKKAKARIAAKLREQEKKSQEFRIFNQKVKNNEELTMEELKTYSEPRTKNTKMEKELQTNDWVIDTLIREKFEDPMYYDVFVARCRDIGEPVTVEKAKYFKDEINALNKGSTTIINCFSLKLGINAITSLCKHARDRKFEVINIADNAISDSGMHAVKGLISSNCCTVLNLASNMISESGLNMVLKDLTMNTSLESLDLGIWKKSIRKNSIGFVGAKCLAAMLIHNRKLTTLKLQDNDIGVKGADIISQALKQNKSLAHLKLAENSIQTEGAEQLMKSNFSLTSLDLGKNSIASKIGTTLQYFVSNSFKLQSLNLEHNNLQLKGIEFLTSGLLNSRSLKVLNVSGNSIGDKGLKVLLRGVENHSTLQELRVAFNEITPIGGAFMIDVLARTNLKSLDLSRNVIEDETLIMLGDLYKAGERIDLCYLNVNSCHITDVGLLYFMEAIEPIADLKYLAMKDNFISEQCEKLLLELVDKNQYLTEFELKGNRISMSCLSRIQGKLKRNLHCQGIKEPNKLKNEVYRLNFERDKVKEAQAQTEKLFSEILTLEAEKQNIEAKLQSHNDKEAKRRAVLEAKILAQEEIIIKKGESVQAKKDELVSQKKETDAAMAAIIAKNDEAAERKNKLEKDIKALAEKFEQMSWKNERELEGLRKELTDLKAKRKDLQEKKETTVRRTQALIENQAAKKF